MKKQNMYGNASTAQMYVLQLIKDNKATTEFVLDRGCGGEENVHLRYALQDCMLVEKTDDSNGLEMVHYSQVRKLHPAFPNA